MAIESVKIGESEVFALSDIVNGETIDVYIEYANNISFWLDVKIFILTLATVFGKGSDGDVESFYDRK